MDKQGTSWTLTIIMVFIVLVITAFILTVGARGGFSKLFGWVDDQIAGIKPLSLLIEKAEKGEELTEMEKQKLEKESPETYAEVLFNDAKEAFEEAHDYSFAEKKFNEYLDECEKRKTCLPSNKEKAVNYLLKIRRINSAEDDFDAIKMMDDDVKLVACKTFIDNYREFIDIPVIKSKLESVKIIHDSLERSSAKNKLQDVLSKSTPSESELIEALEYVDRLRFQNVKVSYYDISYDDIKNLVSKIFELSPPNYQLKAEAWFLEFIFEIENFGCRYETYFRDEFELYTNLGNFEYVTMSYPYDKNGLPYKTKDNTWTFDYIANEIDLIIGWCAFKDGEYTKAFEIADSLEAFDTIKNSIETALSESARYQLYRKSVLELAEPVKCRTEIRRNMESCHTPPEVLYILEEGKTVEINDIEVTKEVTKNYPKLGCYFNWDSGGYCASCEENIFSCGNYATGRATITGDFPAVCREDPCGISSSGCKVLEVSWGFDRCVGV